MQMIASAAPAAARARLSARSQGHCAKAPFLGRGASSQRSSSRRVTVMAENPFRFLEGLREQYKNTGNYSWDGASAVPQAKKVPLARGETLTSVAATHGMTASALAAANGLTNPDAVPEGTELWIPDVHTIASGETLTSIAKGLGVSVADLLACNNIPNPDKIYAGDVLVIPSK